MSLRKAANTRYARLRRVFVPDSGRLSLEACVNAWSQKLGIKYPLWYTSAAAWVCDGVGVKVILLAYWQNSLTVLHVLPSDLMLGTANCQDCLG